MDSHPAICIKKKIVISETYLRTLSLYVQRGNNLTFCKDGEEITIESAEEESDQNATMEINVNVNENGENILENISSSFLRMFQKGYNLKDKREKTEETKAHGEKAVCVQTIDNVSLSPYVCEQLTQPLTCNPPTEDNNQEEKKFLDESFTENKKFEECNSSILKGINNSVEFPCKSPLKDPEILFQDIFSPKTYNYLNATSSEHQSGTEIGFNGKSEQFDFKISLVIKSVESLEITSLIFNEQKNLPMRFVFSFMNRKYESQTFYKDDFKFPFTLLPKTHFSIKGEREKFEKILSKNILLFLYRANERIGRSSVPASQIVEHLKPLGTDSSEEEKENRPQTENEFCKKLNSITKREQEESEEESEEKSEEKENSPIRKSPIHKNSPLNRKYAFQKE